jgi:hypothetical protein
LGKAGGAVVIGSYDRNRHSAGDRPSRQKRDWGVYRIAIGDCSKS